MGLNPYSRYPSNTAAPTAGYPYGSARNVTVTGDGTGTPWEEDIINDILGFQQQLLDAAGITPSGNPDEVGTSDYFDAMRLTAGYPGTSQPYFLNVTPASLGLRMLLLDGSGILVANYPDLVANTYIGDTDNPTADAFFRANDAGGAVRNTAGAYLILPDTRGRFLRGMDVAGNYDPDGATRTIGDNQLMAIMRHSHNIVDPNDEKSFDFVTIQEGTGTSHADMLKKTGSTGAGDAFASNEYLGNGYNDDNLVAGTSVLGDGIDNRPVNTSCNWGIWY